MKLRGKILLAFLLVGLPLVGIDAWWIARQHRLEQGGVLERLRGEAGSASAVLQIFLGSLAARGEQTARYAPTGDALPPYLASRVVDLRRWNAGIAGLVWLDADGRVVAGHPADLGGHGARAADAETLQALRDGQVWALDDFALGRGPAPASPLFRLLVRDAEGPFRGAVGIALGPEVLRSLFPAATTWGHLRLADRAGRLVYATDRAEPSPDERAGWAQVPGVRAALRDGAGVDPGTTPPRAPHETAWMAAHIRIPRLGWVASALAPVADAMGASRETLYKEIATHGLLVALCAAAALILAHRIATPARGLAAAARRIAAGDRAARVRLAGRDELAAVGRAFDEMADALESSWQALTAQRNAAQEMALRMATLNQLAGLVSSSLDPRRVFDFVAEAASRLLDGAASLLLVADEAGDELSISAWHGVGNPGLRMQNRLRAGEGLAGWVLQRREPLVLSDILADSRTVNRPWVQAEGLRAFAGVPLVFQDRCLGVLCAMRAGNRLFRREDVDLLAAFAAHAATAIESARLYQRAESERERLRAVLEAMPEAISVGEEGPTPGEIRLVFGNRARAELLRTAELVSGSRTPHYEFLRADGTALEDAGLPIQRAIWRGETLRGMEMALRFPEGGQHFVLANAVPLRGADGRRQAICIFQDFTQRKREEEELRHLVVENAALYQQAARESRVKGLLLEELNHRVRNNLAVIVSFLELQKGSPGGREALPVLEDAIARVQGLALVHKVLAGTGYEAGEYGTLVRGLAEQTLLEGPLAGRVTFQVEGPPLRLPSAQLTALGLITNELFTNIAKHAFPDDRTGTVHVVLETAGRQVTIRVRDNGVGLPPGFARQPGHLGLELIQSLAEVSLKGTFALESGEGTTAVIRFRLPG